MSDPLNLVFGALADPSRRQVIGYLSERGTATATELTFTDITSDVPAACDPVDFQAVTSAVFASRPLIRVLA